MSATACALPAFLAAALGATCPDKGPPQQPTFYRSLAAPGGKLDPASAQSMISGYRRNNGLGIVTLDPTLMRLAEEQARAMAQRDKMDHDVLRPFTTRIAQSGYDAKMAVENIGAGYHTLAEAFSGWRDSPPHRKNMLHKNATQMGIAAVYAPNTKYKVYWALILGAPAEKPAEAASDKPAEKPARKKRS